MHLPECVVYHPVFPQDGKKLLFHAPVDSTVIALVDCRLGVSIGLADINKLLQQLWLKIGHPELHLSVRYPANLV